MKQSKKIMSLILAMTVIFSLAAMAGCSQKAEDTTVTTVDPSIPTDPEELKEHNSFISGIGGVSETYTGSVSEETYETNVQAAAAYVEKEVAGKQSVSIVNTVSKGTLDQAEVKALNIPKEDSADIVSVEELEVEYLTENTTAQNDAGSTVALGTLNTSRTVKVYIIKYENSFKYYTPCPITGETINQSYYDSVFNAEKYKNCTYRSSMVIEGTVEIAGSGKSTVKMNMDQTLLFSENAILIETTATTSMMGEEQGSSLYAYVEKTEDALSCYVSLDKENWMRGSLTTVGFNSLEELAPFHDQYLDYSYFTKTGYGFELSEENANQYVQETLSKELELSKDDDFTIEMFAKYYVSNGVLSGMRMDINMERPMGSDFGGGSFTVVAETTVTNYGTTVVEKPFD